MLGLEESGAVKCLWGIEVDEAAARAFEKNHAGCKIFINDCNLLLKVNWEFSFCIRNDAEEADLVANNYKSYERVFTIKIVSFFVKGNNLLQL